ncbi:MAG: protein-L-isoaspartate O-methyltransferase family protein [Rhodoferax sp.]
MNYEQARFNMIEQQIRPWNVLDDQVLHLLSVIKREDFVPLAHKALAFVDMEIPLGHGQFMLAPRLEARLLQDAAVQKHMKVLEIGAGSGYLTALLAHQAQRVIALEINPELAAMARANLQKSGIHNAEVRQFDGSVGAAAEGPFDVIILGGCVTEVPPNLLSQLKIGGRLLGIVGLEPVTRATIITRVGDAEFETRQPWDSSAPALLNFPVPSTFRF